MKWAHLTLKPIGFIPSIRMEYHFVSRVMINSSTDTLGLLWKPEHSFIIWILRLLASTVSICVYLATVHTFHVQGALISHRSLYRSKIVGHFEYNWHSISNVPYACQITDQIGQQDQTLFVIITFPFFVTIIIVVTTLVVVWFPHCIEGSYLARNFLTLAFCGGLGVLYGLERWYLALSRIISVGHSSLERYV